MRQDRLGEAHKQRDKTAVQRSPTAKKENSKTNTTKQSADKL